MLLNLQFIEMSALALTKHIGSKQNGYRIRDYCISVLAWQT